jgi:hypothetical protein
MELVDTHLGRIVIILSILSMIFAPLIFITKNLYYYRTSISIVLFYFFLVTTISALIICIVKIIVLFEVDTKI